MRRKNFKLYNLELSRYNKLILIPILSLFLFFGFNSPILAQTKGASLYLSPSTGTYVINSKFSIAIKINTGSQVINAAEGTINFDNNLLEVVSISKSGSIFPFWTTNPTFSNSNGTISFGGGLPPPAYSGGSGHICTILFKAKKSGGAQVRFSTGAVLANDGKGTNILASMGSGSYIISPHVTAPTQSKKNKQSTIKKQEKLESEEELEPEYNKPIITSLTHPNQNIWYNKNNIQFSWELPDNVDGVSIGFDNKPISDPGPVSDGLFDKKEYKDIKDGVWYLHLKFKDNKQWGTIANFRVMIDTKPPLPFEIKVNEIKVGNWPTLIFETKDESSGIKQYEIIIGSLETKYHIVDNKKTFFKVNDLELGEHTAIIKAVDKAGNETYSKEVKFVIKPIESPIIKNYSNEIKLSDQFFMSGTSLANVDINVFIQEGKNLIITKTIKSDNNGNWFYVSQKALDNGRYVAWVDAVNDKGIKSESSNKISFLVTPPIFTRFGSFIINYFTVFVSLLFMIILIIASFLYIAGAIRKRLKKETIEVEDVLHNNLNNLKKAVDQELTQLNKFKTMSNFRKKRATIGLRLKNNIEDTEKKIKKEIKDIEDILK